LDGGSGAGLALGTTVAPAVEPPAAAAVVEAPAAWVAVTDGPEGLVVEVEEPEQAASAANAQAAATTVGTVRVMIFDAIIRGTVPLRIAVGNR
jgi:hypothetical protein